MRKLLSHVLASASIALLAASCQLATGDATSSRPDDGAEDTAPEVAGQQSPGSSALSKRGCGVIEPTAERKAQIEEEVRAALAAQRTDLTAALTPTVISVYFHVITSGTGLATNPNSNQLANQRARQRCLCQHRRLLRLDVG